MENGKKNGKLREKSGKKRSKGENQRSVMILSSSTPNRPFAAFSCSFLVAHLAPGGGVFLGILGGDVPPGFSIMNPDPTSDQKM